MICIIGSETTQNYGLFNDLRHLPDYLVVFAKPPAFYGTIAWRVARRINPDLMRFYQEHVRWKRLVLKNLEKLDRIVVVDTALRRFDIGFLNQCKEIKPGIQIDCLLLNSTGSWTFAEPVIHTKFYSFHWDTVLSFDPHDAEQNGWKYTGLHYYSKTHVPATDKSRFDLFFAGALLEKRGKTLLHLLDCFNSNSVNCLYICPCKRRDRHFSTIPKGLHLIQNRISYRKILKKMIKSNCILEILQEGQGGSTLRYCEAVCYNKKLLTTNSEIVHYPFYNERYMKVFSTEADIDYEWIKKPESIDYGYNNEFSPIHLFRTVS